MSRKKNKQPDQEEKYVNYISEHMKELSDEIEKAFEDKKDTFKKAFIEEIKDALIPVPVHYRWVDDGCPYDHSGELIEDGLIDLDQTLIEFLLFEYSGYKTPTFDSGCGFRYDYYHELIDRYTFDLSFHFTTDIMRNRLNEVFNDNIDEDYIYDILDKADEFMFEIRLSSHAFEYELSEETAQIYGLSDTTLSDILKEVK